MSKIKTNETSKNLILGICGGIAAYKCADLTRRLKERGFDVRVVMTSSAKEFITPMTLQAVSGHPVHDDLFDPQAEASMGHIELAKWADLILIAPATANTIAKINHGKANNLLTSLILASKAKLMLAPAMNQQMWANEATQCNICDLQAKGVDIIGPASGEQACGDVGAGRMVEPLDIAIAVERQFCQKGLLTGKKLVITAGPTLEAIDPVRYISNHSSGKMGYAIAKAAQLAGAQVYLVSGPCHIAVPQDVNYIQVTSADDMFNAVKELIEDTDIFIGCAAVADYKPVNTFAQKIKKSQPTMQIELIKNIDILAWVGEQKKAKLVVGFAAESEKLKEYALKKLHKKQLDLICANDISQSGLGFNSDNNQLLLIDKNENEFSLPIERKEILAMKIVQQIAKRL